VTVYSQLRPTRQGGIRIEREVADGKVIVHNYGHGGAGISLSPSTALEAVELAQSSLKPQSEVAIIGSGIVGIMTAHQILQK
jgi:D-amino-acid oxidase